MIIRRQHTANFTTIGNKLFDDERLAADEVGILAYLLSRSHNWEVRRPALMRRWGIGREAIRRIIRNLVRYGYCRAERKRMENGTTFVIYEIRDEPGPELTEDEAKRALALDSSAAASGQIDGETGPDHIRMDDDPLTGYPSPVGPPLADPSMAYIDLPKTDLTKDESTQKPERESARAREKHALNLIEFKRRWPTNASDDQVKVDNAWFDLTNDEGEAALAGIAPFLENQKRLGKKYPPAGFNYLGQKRWTLLEQAQTDAAAGGCYPPESVEAKAIRVLHDLVGRGAAFWKIYRNRDGSVSAGRFAMTPQLRKLGEAPPVEQWVTLSAPGEAASWERMLGQFFDPGMHRQRLREGCRAPWNWAPSAKGTLYAASEDDLADLK